MECFRLTCTGCGWGARCGEPQMLSHLRRIGKVRPARSPEPEFLREVFFSCLAVLTCPDCGDLGLKTKPWTDEWDDEDLAGKPCEGCRQPIPAERLEALPTSKLCARCQERSERGESFDEVDYCPRCGSPMEVRQAGGRGITRYVMSCGSCGR